MAEIGPIEDHHRNGFHPQILTKTPFLLGIEAISRSPWFIGFVNARRDLLALVIVAILIVLALLYQGSTRIPSWNDENLVRIMISFALIGVVLGLAFRHCWQRMVFLALVGKRRLSQILLMNSIWSLGIVFFPRGVHVSAAAPYLCGIAVGLLLHKGSRFRLTQAAAAYRRLEHIAEAWPPRASAPPVEQTALRLLARGRQLPLMRFTKLRRFLEECRQEGPLTKRLALISASVFRLEGEWQRAIDEVAEGGEDLQEIADAHLALLKIMSLDELGLTEKADRELKRVLESTPGKDCPLANALLAYREAERLLFEPNEAIPPTRPLEQVTAAMDLRARIFRARLTANRSDEASVDRFLGRFLEIGVPITASFWMDILGYCHLTAGHAEEAGALFQRCIDIDPAFSPAFLHLGDYFFFRNSLAYGGAAPSRADLWHATACYVAALTIERNAASRIRRQARSRIDHVRQLSDGQRQRSE